MHFCRFRSIDRCSATPVETISPIDTTPTMRIISSTFFRLGEYDSASHATDRSIAARRPDQIS